MTVIEVCAEVERSTSTYSDLRPSAADLAATEELKDLSKRLSVRFLDHLIIGRGGFASLAEME